MEHSISSTNDTVAESAASIAAIIAQGLLVAGGLNWAMVGLFDVDLIAALLGPLSLASRIAYVLVGVAAVYGLTLFPRLARQI